MSGLLVGLGGCSWLPHKQDIDPITDIAPAHWHNQQTSASEQQAGAANSTGGSDVTAAYPSWLDELGSEPLKQLVSTAIEGNPELQYNRLLWIASTQNIDVVEAAEQPGLDLNLSAGRRDSGAGPVDSFQGELAFSWELDLWNRLSNATQSALASSEALGQDLAAAKLSLAATVTKAWLLLIESRQQVELSKNLVSNLEANVSVLEENYNSGIVSALDIHLARANLAAERARYVNRQRLEGEQQRSLQRLLGVKEANYIPTPEQLPALPDSVPAGLPSTLLERRPDIRAAQWRFNSAVADYDVAYADRFPRLSLTASYGHSSDELSSFLSGDSLIWGLLASVTQPLLDGGRLQALSEQARTAVEQTRVQYVGVVLDAFTEVESALAQEAQYQQQVEAIRVSSEQSDYAEQLAIEEYRRGLADYITVLEAQRRAFTARSTLVETRQQLLANRINLYLALGGDFASAP